MSEKKVFSISTLSGLIETEYLEEVIILGEVFVIHKSSDIEPYRMSHKLTGFGINGSDGDSVEAVREAGEEIIASVGKQKLDAAIEKAMSINKTIMEGGQWPM